MDPYCDDECWKLNDQFIMTINIITTNVKHNKYLS
jgi:hypothetical protein